jgi:Arc/MetJ family transcription regulator
VRLDHIDIDDDLAAEVERRAPDMTWSDLIGASLRFALTQADAEQHGSQPPDDETA